MASPRGNPMRFSTSLRSPGTRHDSSGSVPVANTPVATYSSGVNLSARQPLRVSIVTRTIPSAGTSKSWIG
jgi:hypothetical protein